MKEKLELLTVMRDSVRGFSPYYLEEVTALLGGEDEVHFWYPLQIARGIDPQPLTVERFEYYFAFSSPERRRKRLRACAGDGFFAGSESEGYHLSDKGRRMIESVYYTAHKGLAAAPALPVAESGQLVTLLRRLVRAAEQLPEPREKLSLKSSVWTHPGRDASDAALIDQYVTDLLRFRDDAHSTAWRNTGLSGPAWDMLTMIWSAKEECLDADELQRLASEKGYDEALQESALEALGERGWVIQSTGALSLSAEGRQVRDDAEAVTNRLFFAGWDTLSDADLQALGKLLSGLAERLAEANKQPVAA